MKVTNDLNLVVVFSSQLESSYQLDSPMKRDDVVFQNCHFLFMVLPHRNLAKDESKFPKEKVNIINLLIKESNKLND